MISSRRTPDAVRAFIQAYKGAERWANDHPDEAEELTAEAVGMHHVTSHVYSDSGEITDAILQPWIDAMVMDGTISEGQVKPSDLYITEFSDLWANEIAPQPLDPFPLSLTAGNVDLDPETSDVILARTAAT